ncbi:hypothetical protein [Parendozoicomonas haliclonae]|uniref:Uncharacterized protein n=1 Tax=Parendozoicomonas haliclonae TaxID=1960125 RepID=A0A1X7AEI4_9GAMM|nr:hypothetical protein [Parendozoicomonas haliclonae]SMA32444.1 hypothetical protein EHSB41UT_00151 [Parendozoicomonas haliclonae]
MARLFVTTPRSLPLLSTLLLLLTLPVKAEEKPAEEQPVDNPDIPTYDIGDNFHQYPPDYREPDPEAPVRYGRSTSKSFPLQALDVAELSEAQVPGALQATAAGEELSEQESQLLNSDGTTTIEELENSGVISLLQPVADGPINNTSRVTINNQTYNTDSASGVNVQMDAVITTRN